MLLKIRTLPPKPPLRQRLRKHALIKQLKQIPIPRAALRLEVPKDPALRLSLVRIELHLDVATDIVLPLL